MPKRIFLDRKQLLVDAIVDHLGDTITGEMPFPDFGKIAVVLPGMAARRAVQKRLAEKFGALIPPKLMMPSQLLRYGEAAGHTASVMETQLIWNRAVAKALETPEKFDLLFPGGAVDLRRMPGKLFAPFREELTRGGIAIAEAAEALGSRGAQLAALERIFLAELEKYGFDDPLALDRRAASEVESLAAFDRIILAGVPDLPHMLKKRLENFCAAYPDALEFWIHAPESESAAFDDFGVPLADVWATRQLPAKLDAMELAVDASDAAVRARNFLVATGDEFDPENAVVALADPQLEEFFIDAFSRIGGATKSPLAVSSSTGVPAGKLRLARLGAALLDFLKNSDDFNAGAALLTERDFLAAFCDLNERENEILAAFCDRDACENEMLTSLDDFRLTRYPDDFNAALAFLRELAPRNQAAQRLLPVMEFLAKLPQELESSASPAAFLRNFYNRVFDRELDREERSFGISLGDEIDLFRRKLGELEALSADLTEDAGRLATLELFFQNFEAEMLPGARGEFVLEGMLEIPFFTASRVALVGINEKFYPDRIAPSAFLNDSIRKKLHLRHNGDTFARAMCHLRSLLDPREEDAVRFFVLKQSPKKEMLRPSPLFFAGDLPEAEILGRTHKLFGEVSALATASAAPVPVEGFTFDWKSDEIAFFHHLPVLAVTAFKRYLANPVDFFFSDILYAEPTDYALSEPDARGFGTICHAAFERLREEPCDSAEKFYAVLERNLRAYLRENFGETLPVLIKLQADNLLQRFQHAAPLLEKERRDGFMLLETEYRFGGGIPIPLGQGFVKGTADRIEYRAASNTLRILDLKTGKIASVAEEHYQSKKKKFINLQLPLYAIMLRRDGEFARRHPEIDLANVKIECGYLLLPRAVTESRVEIWEPAEFDALLGEAEVCAARVIVEVMRMKEKIFVGDPARASLTGGMARIIPDVEAALPRVSWQEAENDGE